MQQGEGHNGANPVLHMIGFKVVAQVVADALAADGFRELGLLFLGETAQQQVLFFQSQQALVFGFRLFAPLFKQRQIVDATGYALVIEVVDHLLLYQQVAATETVFQCLQFLHQFLVFPIELPFSAVTLFHQCLLDKDFAGFLRIDLAVDSVLVLHNTKAKQCLTLFGHDLAGFNTVERFAIGFLYQMGRQRLQPVRVDFGYCEGKLFAGFHQ